jgi:hypothetical protein
MSALETTLLPKRLQQCLTQILCNPSFNFIYCMCHSCVVLFRRNEEWWFKIKSLLSYLLCEYIPFNLQGFAHGFAHCIYSIWTSEFIFHMAEGWTNSDHPTRTTTSEEESIRISHYYSTLQGPPISSLLSGHLGSPVVDQSSLSSSFFYYLVFWSVDHTPLSLHHSFIRGTSHQKLSYYSYAFLWAFQLLNPHRFSFKEPWLVSFSLKNRTAEELLHPLVT